MSKMIVNSESLTAIANAIREKANITDSLVFPSGFIDVISALVEAPSGVTEMASGSITADSNIIATMGIDHNMNKAPNFVLFYQDGAYSTTGYPLQAQLIIYQGDTAAYGLIENGDAKNVFYDRVIVRICGGDWRDIHTSRPERMIKRYYADADGDGKSEYEYDNPSSSYDVDRAGGVDAEKFYVVLSDSATIRKGKTCYWFAAHIDVLDSYTLDDFMKD